MYIYVCKGKIRKKKKKEVICKVFINLKDNENQLLITKTIILIKNIFNEKKNYQAQRTGLRLVIIIIECLF